MAGTAKSRVTRVEFRYKRECLREMGVEEAYAFLDQLPSPLGVLHQAVAAAHPPLHRPQQGALAHLTAVGGGATGDLLRRWRASRARAQDGRRSAR